MFPVTKPIFRESLGLASSCRSYDIQQKLMPELDDWIGWHKSLKQGFGGLRKPSVPARHPKETSPFASSFLYCLQKSAEQRRLFWYFPWMLKSNTFPSTFCTLFSFPKQKCYGKDLLLYISNPICRKTRANQAQRIANWGLSEMSSFGLLLQTPMKSLKPYCRNI